MVSRNTLEFLVGLVVAGGVTSGLSLSVPLAYALAVGLAAGTPSLVRTSMRLNRQRYEDDHSSTEQVVDGALAAAATLVVGLLGGYVAIANGHGGSIGAAVAAGIGVFGGQATFYFRNHEYVE
jgi:hypothetical protein